MDLSPDNLRHVATQLLLLADALTVTAEIQHPEPVQQSLAEWYIARAAALAYSSESDDRLAALAAGFGASREVIRELRREFAPDHWSRPGRRTADIARISRQRRI